MFYALALFDVFVAAIALILAGVVVFFWKWVSDREQVPGGIVLL